MTVFIFEHITHIILKIVLFNFVQKEPPEVFYKKRCSKKFGTIHRKTLVLEFLFNKVADLRPQTLLKKRLRHMRFPVNCAKFLRISSL